MERSALLRGDHPGDQSNDYSYGSVNGAALRGDEDEPTYLQISSDASSHDTGINGSDRGYPRMMVYKSRWWIMGLFSAMAFLQGGLGNVWSVIAESAEAAFGWDDKQVSLMQAWMYGTYLIAMFPFAYLMDKKGMRIAAVLSAFSLALGTALRCISVNPPLVTWMAQLGHMFVGIAGPVCFQAGPVLAAMWFPVEQRTTATAIATVAGFGGAAAVFILGPSIVEQPKALNVTGGTVMFSNIAAIKEEILHCRYAECGICVLVFFCVVLYFPDKPPMPPTISASLGKLNLKAGLRDMFRRENASFWLLAFSFAQVLAIYGVWSALLDVNLKPKGIPENEAGMLGALGVAGGCVAGVIIGRLSDYSRGHMKAFLLVVTALQIVFCFWFLLIVQEYIPLTRYGLYTSYIGMGIFVNASPPLYFEMAIEKVYPVPEFVASAMINILYNVLPLCFLFIFTIPGLGSPTVWMNWFMYAMLLISFPMILCFKEEYRRLNVDIGDTESMADSQVAESATRVST